MRHLTNANILIISPEAWGMSLLSKHQYAIALARANNQVWFLEPNVLDPTTCLEPNVHLVREESTTRGLRFMPSWLRKKIVEKSAQRLQKRCGVTFDIIWSFDNSRYADLDVFRKAFHIHHLMDFHYDFQLETAARAAQLCLGVSEDIVEKIRPFNPNVFLIGHGYAPEQKRENVLPAVKEKYKAAYAGNLLITYIAWDWLFALIEENNDTHFFFFGGFAKNNLNQTINQLALQNIERLAQCSNVTLMGEQTPSDLAGYLDGADILLHAYQGHNPGVTSNSLKIMTYLGTGKPIVASEISSYKKLPDLVHCAKSKEEYCALFLHVKENLNEELGEKSAKRVAYALANSYNNHLREIDALINNVQ
jgi:hypothetical protein